MLRGAATMAIGIGITSQTVGSTPLMRRGKAVLGIGTTLHPRLLLRMRSIGHTKPPPSKVEMEPLKRVCEPTAIKMEEKGCKVFTESTLTTMA